MSRLEKILLVGSPLLLLVLTAIAGFAFSKVRYLLLPIPQALTLFTVVLPIMTGISLQGVYSLIKRSSQNKQYQLTIPFIAVIGFQLIYETIVGTLALTYMVPPSSLRCGLEEKWRKLYVAKDGDAIRRIQDAFDCCGFNTIKDAAWPFGQPSPCASTFGRTNSCFAPWRKSEQVQAGLLLLVAILVFVIKVISIISLLTNYSERTMKWARKFKHITNHRHEDDVEDRATMRGLIEESAEGENYQDNLDEASNGNGAHAEAQGPRIEPSPLIDSGHNDWRDGEEEGRET